MGVFMNHNLAEQLRQISNQVPASAAPMLEKFQNPQLLLSPEVRTQIPGEILELLEKALSYAIDTVFAVSLIIAVAGIFMAFFYGKAMVTDKAVRTAEES